MFGANQLHTLTYYPELLPGMTNLQTDIFGL